MGSLVEVTDFYGYFNILDSIHVAGWFERHSMIAYTTFY